MTDQQRADFAAKLLGGYTHEQLTAAFDTVCDPKDWRAPIRGQVPLAEFNGPLLTKAIVFFTSTEPRFVTVDAPSGTVVLVIADGYRQGPAGDH